MIGVIPSIEGFGGHPAFLLKSIAHRQRARAGFCRIGEIGGLISEVLRIREDLAHVVKAGDDIHAGSGALINRRLVTKRLVGVIGAALGLRVKEIDVDGRVNRHRCA